jgi:hypothetical protein
MIHTEVDLPADVYQDVERLAKESKRKPAQVMRDLITQSLRTRPRPAKTTGGLGALADLGIKGPSDFASRLDDYMYGDE